MAKVYKMAKIYKAILSFGQRTPSDRNRSEPGPQKQKTKKKLKFRELYVIHKKEWPAS